jgi:hypothetical protein
MYRLIYGGGAAGFNGDQPRQARVLERVDEGPGVIIARERYE